MNAALELKRMVLCASACLALACGQEGFAQLAPAGPSEAGGTLPSSVPSDVLRYTPQEQVILDGISDGDSQFETTGLYVLLEHASRLPARAEESAHRADQPAIDNLWSEPETYRGRLIRLRGHYAGLTEERQVAGNPWFKSKFFLLHMKVPKAREAIVVALTQPPPVFQLGQPLEVTGLMYKTVAWQTREDSGEGGARRQFPVIVARTVVQAGVADPVQGSHQTLYMVIAITGLVILMLAVRLWRMRSMRRAGFIHSQNEAVSAEDDEGEVDPELCQAVEQWQSDTPADAPAEVANPPDGSSRKEGVP